MTQPTNNTVDVSEALKEIEVLSQQLADDSEVFATDTDALIAEINSEVVAAKSELDKLVTWLESGSKKE